ncbi:predicted protein [Nematostella vectensis]|uniref:Uncharacterized protein n=1 Tax=Nematostella vectensis TaxID=45351 RepID=A7T0T6_NEMVE|nr:predicted protein [Nematostella vectensis]|eukprot:XP_001622533.1 predicted protein [Nematostella vectensis]
MQIGEWLGFTINTIAMEFSIPSKKVVKLKSLLDRVITDEHSTFRELARIAAVFRLLNIKWGPYTIDRFATHYNAQLSRFHSKFAAPGSCGVDAFTQEWSGLPEKGYLERGLTFRSTIAIGPTQVSCEFRPL